MFTSREALDAGGGTASLGLRLTGIGAPSARAAQGKFDPLSRRFERLRLHWDARLARLDWTPDLAEDMGSRRWFRGLGTLFGLSAFALAFLPDFSTIAAPPAMPLDAAARDAFRSQAIRPIAFGAGTGFRMAPSDRVSPAANLPERAIVQLTATYGQGDSFERLLQRAGVGAGDSARVTSLVAGSIDSAGLAPGTKGDITLGRRAALRLDHARGWAHHLELWRALPSDPRLYPDARRGRFRCALGCADLCRWRCDGQLRRLGRGSWQSR